MKPINRENPLVIPVHVDDERMLYDSLDPSGLRLSDSFISYLQDFIEDRKPGESVRLELTGNTMMDTERFRKSYQMCVEKLQRRNRRERVKQSANAVRLLVIGIAFVLIGIAFTRNMGEVIAAIVSTVGSFSIWEASAIWIEAIPEITAKGRILVSLRKAQIAFGKGEEK